MGYVCLHGHFYQPPRENPWLEAVELQDSAYPYHDWNERITAECYAPNGASRILDEQQRIAKIVNNYGWISFNFGPTLLSWLRAATPGVYRAVLEGDKLSEKRFAGHGSALAQAYNHMILPLAHPRDKRTQILWGIRDFEFRFGRKPEGMWLPETAVDLESLDIMAEHGIKFTILAPRQAARTRRVRSKQWNDVSGERIDPTMAYRLRTPSGKNIALFFYDGPISRGVAFEGFLNDGKKFADRLLGAFSDQRAWPELVHIATDGETYGHHHMHGEMALSYALDHIETNDLAGIINYGQYLAEYPPTHEVEIFENSSWSCIHGIERWRSDCGCNSGRAGWNQGWRAPLREALDLLRDSVAPRFEEAAKPYLKDPWAARDAYIDIILDRAPDSICGFLRQHATRELEGDEIVEVLKLLELQRHAMLMYTSCGWFFDDISGIETVQVIQYAGRVLQLAKDIWGDGVEGQVLEGLAKAKSNVPEHQDGRAIYEKWVIPTIVTLEKVAAHYAISSLFTPHTNPARIYCYTIDKENEFLQESGQIKLALTRIRVLSEITHEAQTFITAALHLGDHSMNCGVRESTDSDEFQNIAHNVTDAFSRGDIAATIRAVDRELGQADLSLKSLFRDDQRAVLKHILTATIDEAETAYRQIHERHGPLIHVLQELGVPLPKAIGNAAEFAMNSILRHELEAQPIDVQRVKNLLNEVRDSKLSLDSTTLEYTVRASVERLFDRFRENSDDLKLLDHLNDVLELIRSLPFSVALWAPQNVWFEMRAAILPQHEEKAGSGDAKAGLWVKGFKRLGERLSARVD